MATYLCVYMLRFCLCRSDAEPTTSARCAFFLTWFPKQSYLTLLPERLGRDDQILLYFLESAKTLKMTLWIFSSSISLIFRIASVRSLILCFQKKAFYVLVFSGQLNWFLF